MSLRFVNLHGHDGQSIYDGIGSPEDYAEFMLKNAGEDSGALAITNHGNMNSIGYMVAAQKKYKAKGAPVKFIYGVEAYYIPSLEEWAKIKAQREEGDSSDLVIENEKESKSKWFDPINRRHHLVLVAMNQKGLQNLYRLVSRSYRQGFYRKPRVDLNMLKELNEGIIASTACLAGVPTWVSLQTHQDGLDKTFEMYDKELFPLMETFGKERFYLELQFNRIPEQQIVNGHLVEYAKKTGYNLIATADCHYPSPDMFRDREIYRLLGYQMQKREVDMSILEKSADELECELYLKNGDQLFKAYKESDFGRSFGNDQLIADAIERTYGIAHDLIGQVAPDDAIKLPKTFQVTDTIKSPFDKLKALCLEGMKKKGLTSPEYINRAAFELKIIREKKMEEYFLTLKEMLDVLRTKMLVGTGRGSGAGSLLNYLLDITFLDPIKEGLLFERFISVSRAEMADVDNDVEDRDLALEILRQHFGKDNVLTVSNYNTLQLKSLVKDISRLYGIPFDEVNEVTKVMEGEARPSIMEEIGHDQKLYEFTYEKAREFSSTFREFIEKYPKVGERIDNLFKEVKSIGRHAGGVLIVPDAEGCLPIVRIRGVDQSPITEGITAQHLKYFGLIKYDVLGLTTLRIIRRCIEIILRSGSKDSGVLRTIQSADDRKLQAASEIRSDGDRRSLLLSNEGTSPSDTIGEVWEFYNKYLHPNVINTRDPEVFRNCYQGGRFPSVFQFAKEDVQNFCVRAFPESVADISAITALWRPGPLKGGADARYIEARERGVDKNEHPIIKEVLGETKGLLVYQEQFMLLAHKLAGFSLDDADKLRKLLVKPAKELGEEMKKQRIEAGIKFVKGCIERGVEEERAHRLWDEEILGFISYGFNKSHSQCYAYNSFQCAWLFTYYPDEWIRACLECDADLTATISAVSSVGYKIVKPDVNSSLANEWRVDQNICYPSLIAVKGIGDTAASELIASRTKPFESLEDFFYEINAKGKKEWRWSKFNKRSIEALIRLEAFESLNCVGRDKLFKNYRHMYNTIIGEFDKVKKGKIPLEELAAAAPVDDWDTSQKIAAQKELLGFYNKAQLLEEYRDILREFDITPIDGCEDKTTKENVWAVIEDVEQSFTSAKKKPYLQVTASGEGGTQYKFKVWNVYKEKTATWQEGNVVIFSLEYDEQWGYSLPMFGKSMRVSK